MTQAKDLLPNLHQTQQVRSIHLVYVTSHCYVLIFNTACIDLTLNSLYAARCHSRGFFATN